MDPLLITGWIFLLTSWIPKPFIKDEKKRRLTNIIIAGIALVVFIFELVVKILFK